MIGHRFWTGPPAPYWSNESREWAESNSLDVVDWTDETLPGECVGWVDAHLRGDTARHVSNLVRWWLLAHIPGVWLDHDVWLRQPLRERTGSAAVGLERVSCLVVDPSGAVGRALMDLVPSVPPGPSVNTGDRLLSAHGWGGLIQLPTASDGTLNPECRQVVADHAWHTGGHHGLSTVAGRRRTPHRLPRR